MRFKKPKVTLAEMDMTPMIDVVFQLITFFMLISNFEQTQADERVKLPSNELAKPPDVRRENELTLNVGYNRTKTGEIVSGPFVLYVGEQIPVPEFGDELRRESRNYKEIGKDPKEVTIVIRADADVPTGLVQQLIKLSQEAEFEKFALKARQQALDE